MITPDEFQPVERSAEERDAAQQTRIEEYFDRCLKSGRSDIPYTRSGWLKSNIEAVLNKYRAAGWDCADTGRLYRFTPGAGK